MKKIYLILAAAIGMTITSCTNNDIVEDNPGTGTATTDAINFGFKLQNATRADIAGNAAAELLGNNFYVTGTKGTEPAKSPTTNIVFNNYLVHYEANSAGTQEDNTANWEYVGVVPGTDPTANYAKLSPTAVTAQTIKYWDYSVAQYDFFGFSTGTFKAVKDKAIGDVNADEINVTAMKYGDDLS